LKHDGNNRSLAYQRISEGCFYNWKAKYGGHEVSEAKRLPRVSIEVEA